MSIHDYAYDLPAELIAQAPAERRDSSRLLVLDRRTGATAHRIFSELPRLLRPGDALVLNDTRVLHARLSARRRGTGGHVELLLVRPRGNGRWEALARPARRLRPGEELVLPTGATVTVAGRLEEGSVEVAVPEDVAAQLERHGEAPLPPYIRGFAGDPERYQTVYARERGSAAAPTAGLHFTPELLAELEAAGVSLHYLTLHVGIGTFRPVQRERIEEHKMHAELVCVPAGLTAALSAARAAGGRVIAVGTTSARALEAVARAPEMEGCWTETDIYIRPGHEWRLVDGLVTNFHLPRSSLLVLVSALAGRERILAAYAEAIRERYRFYSFGDAMLIV